MSGGAVTSGLPDPGVVARQLWEITKFMTTVLGFLASVGVAICGRAPAEPGNTFIAVCILGATGACITGTLFTIALAVWAWAKGDA